MEHLKKLRKQRGMTQQEIASKIGITAAAYCKIETGHTDVSIGRLTAIADAMDVSLLFILTGINFQDLSDQKRELEQSRMDLAKKEGEAKALKDMVKLLAADYASI